MTAPELVRSNAGFICGTGGCYSLGQYVQCPACGWSATVPPTEEADGQLILGDDEPGHTPLDCARYQRDHPRRTAHAGTEKQHRASRAYERIHERHAPVRLVQKWGTPTCPRCGYQP